MTWWSQSPVDLTGIVDLDSQSVSPYRKRVLFRRRGIKNMGVEGGVCLVSSVTVYVDVDALVGLRTDSSVFYPWSLGGR